MGLAYHLYKTHLENFYDLFKICLQRLPGDRMSKMSKKNLKNILKTSKIKKMWKKLKIESYKSVEKKCREKKYK